MLASGAAAAALSSLRTVVLELFQPLCPLRAFGCLRVGLSPRHSGARQENSARGFGRREKELPGFAVLERNREYAGQRRAGPRVRGPDPRAERGKCWFFHPPPQFWHHFLKMGVRVQEKLKAKRMNSAFLTHF